MPQGIEDGEEDEAGGSGNGEDDSKAGEDFFRHRCVALEGARVAKPAFGEEGEVEEDGCDATAGDEEGFEALSADVYSRVTRLAIATLGERAGVMERERTVPEM